MSGGKIGKRCPSWLGFNNRAGYAQSAFQPTRSVIEANNPIEEYLKGEKPKKPDEPKVLNAVNAFLRWLAESNVKFVESEKPVLSLKHGFAGILDAICEIDGKRYVVDFKSSKGFYDPFYAQVAAYKLAAAEEGIKTDGCLLIKLGKEDGSFEVREVNDFEKHKKAFLAALTIKRWLNDLKTEL